MYLHTLEATNFRNFENIAITPLNGVNLVYGMNGSGKSSLLEAIYFLARGKSFRQHKPAVLIKNGTESFTLFAKIASETNAATQKLGVTRDQRLTQFKLNGFYINQASTLANVLPVQLIEPKLHHLLEEGPEYRRRFLEWGVFHVEPRYDQEWKRYSRNLAQRNAALKAHLPDKQIRQWEQGLISSAKEIDQMRRKYLHDLFEFMNEATGFEAITKKCRFDYYPGWTKGQALEGVLSNGLASDKERGFTQAGPHRADIRIKIGQERAKDVLSRGQQKLLITLLLLNQCRILKQCLDKDVVILVDDLLAELDRPNQLKFMSLLRDTGCQVFVTATTRHDLEQVCEGYPYRMFHVEHGCISQVV
jgi:DNA replication and repair protein RecF